MTAADRPANSVRARLWRGDAGDPAWARPALWALLAVTAGLFLWGLGSSGYANEFYSAAAQAGSQSGKAFFFGASDAAGSITVDKPPLFLWPMALAVRLFGLNAWSILVPQALEGVATVALLYAAVKRRFGPAAGLIAGGVLALTPIAALMFRFNNPDAMLCLLMVAAVYCGSRALEDGRLRWLLLCGTSLGLGFLAKGLQAWLIVPVLAAVYLTCGPRTLGRRVIDLLWSGLAALASAGWWVAIVELWPASSRPYIGGSQDNSFLGLTFGYNGFGRITGNETGSVGGGGPGGGGGGAWGSTGIARMFAADVGGQIAWLLPAALILFVAGLVLAGRAPRTDARRADVLLWGGSLVVTGLVFSFMAGIFHQYYTIALAPYLAALIGAGVTTLWTRRSRVAVRVVLAAALGVTAAWAFVLLGRSADFLPWLRWTVLVIGVLAALGIALAPRAPRRGLALLAAVAVAAALAGPTSYTVQTVATAHGGSIVTAGPASSTGPGGGQGGPGGMPAGKGGFPGAPNGRAGGPGGTPNGKGAFPNGGKHGPRGREGGGPGGMGGLLNGQKVGAKVASALSNHADDYTWVAAAVGSQNSAGFQLATGHSVMPIGGFNGSDPSPTLAQFQRYVAAGEVHYFISAGDGQGRGGPGGGTSSAITAWVRDHFAKTTVDSTTLYDLTKRTD